MLENILTIKRKNVTLADFLRNDGQKVNHETTKDYEVDNQQRKRIIR